MSTSQTDGASEAMRAAWRQAHVRPLWENPIAHKAREGGPKAHMWKWSELGPLVTGAMKMTSMAAIERRGPPPGERPAPGDAARTSTTPPTTLQTPVAR